MENKRDINQILSKIDLDRYELFIFDFDGTIIEPLRVDWQGLKRKLAELLGVKFYPRVKINYLLTKIKEAHGNKMLEQGYKICEKYELQATAKTKLRPEINSLIEKVSAKRKKLVVFSGNMKITIETVLNKYNLYDKFNQVVSKESVQQYKPNPEGLELILSKAKISSSKAIFLGDLEIDLLAGEKAGVKTVLIN